MFLVLVAWVCLLATPAWGYEEDEDSTTRLRTDSFPRREALVFGLDPGVTLAHTHERGSLPVMIRVNLRGGWCLRPWVMLGADWSMDFVVDDGGYTQEEKMSLHGEIETPPSLFGPKLLQPMVTFWPVLGLTLRAGGGFDPYDLRRFPLTGAAGWEFPIDRHGAFGLMATVSHLFHTDRRPDWQLYTFTLTFTGYQVGRGWLDTLTRDAPREIAD